MHSAARETSQARSRERMTRTSESKMDARGPSRRFRISRRAFLDASDASAARKVVGRSIQLDILCRACTSVHAPIMAADEETTFVPRRTETTFLVGVKRERSLVPCISDYAERGFSAIDRSIDRRRRRRSSRLRSSEDVSITGDNGDIIISSAIERGKGIARQSVK